MWVNVSYMYKQEEMWTSGSSLPEKIYLFFTFYKCFETLQGINIERRWFLKVPNPNTLVQDSWRSKCVISSICCLSRAWPYSAAGEKQAWQGSPIGLWRCQDVDASDPGHIRAVWTCWQPRTGINWQQIMLQEMPFISCQKTNAKWGP